MTAYRTVDVDGVEVFYREAGDRGAPTLLLLHGFPTSSSQYQELIDLLSDRTWTNELRLKGKSATPSSVASC